MKQNVSSYSVVLTPAPEGGFTVVVPAIPGCFTEGDTYEEALENAREAIALCLEDMIAEGEEIPTESVPSSLTTVTVEASPQHA